MLAQVGNVDDLDGMPMMRLMTLAKTMGVDTDALIVTTEQQEDECRRYCAEFPGSQA